MTDQQQPVDLELAVPLPDVDLEPYGPNFAGLDDDDLRTWAALAPAVKRAAQTTGGSGSITVRRSLGERLVRLGIARYPAAPPEPMMILGHPAALTLEIDGLELDVTEALTLDDDAGLRVDVAAIARMLDAFRAVRVPPAVPRHTGVVFEIARNGEPA